MGPRIAPDTNTATDGGHSVNPAGVQERTDSIQQRDVEDSTFSDLEQNHPAD